MQMAHNTPCKMATPLLPLMTDVVYKKPFNYVNNKVYNVKGTEIMVWHNMKVMARLHYQPYGRLL